VRFFKYDDCFGPAKIFRIEYHTFPQGIIVPVFKKSVMPNRIFACVQQYFGSGARPVFSLVADAENVHASGFHVK
jgi:hypothetical protein